MNCGNPGVLVITCGDSVRLFIRNRIEEYGGKILVGRRKVQYMYACIMHHIDRLYVIRTEIHFYMEGNKALNAEGPLTATKPQVNVVNRVKLLRIE